MRTAIGPSNDHLVQDRLRKERRKKAGMEGRNKQIKDRPGEGFCAQFRGSETQNNKNKAAKKGKTGKDAN